jgi:hypothetical protein
MWRGGLLGVMLAAPAGAECRLALALGMDVSASVDSAEYRLQMEGTAAALTSAPVRRVLLGGVPVALGAYLWSGAREQWRVADWTLIEDAVTLEAFAATIAATQRPPFTGRTATGEAMRVGAQFLDEAPACDRRALDLSTDGEANDGTLPAEVRVAGITINALSIGGDLPLDHGYAGEPLRSLALYLERNVIRGPGAFVERAVDYRDFTDAMTRKLLRELAEVMMGEAR